MINLHFSNGKAFVWNAEDVCTLREKHHIVGSLVGFYPSKPFQVQNKSLPLQLMSEEVNLLIEKGIAQLISLPNTVPDSSQIKSFFEKRDNLCKEQVLLLKENRKKEILENADQIYEGKKRKFFETQKKKKKAKKLPETPMETDQSPQDKTHCEEKNINLDPKEDLEHISDHKSIEKSHAKPEPEFMDKNVLIEAELAKVTEVSKELCLIQLFTESPWKSCPNVINWKYPSSELEKLRYAVFKDLWEKKYYITTGSKFGGDFLAYDGDPLKYHALYIVVCKDQEDVIQGNDIVVYGRLGHQVKKTVALASLNEAGEVEYLSLNWENKMK